MLAADSHTELETAARMVGQFLANASGLASYGTILPAISIVRICKRDDYATKAAGERNRKKFLTAKSDN